MIDTVPDNSNKIVPMERSSLRNSSKITPMGRSNLRTTQMSKSCIQTIMFNQGLIPCTQKTCKNGVIVQSQNSQGKEIYKCTHCDKKYCILCLEKEHEGTVCKIIAENQQKVYIKKFKCENCDQDKDPSSKISFCQCGFQMCIQCYFEYLQTTIKKYQVPKCPSGCGADLPNKVRILLDDQLAFKLNKAKFNKVVNQDGLKACKSQKCRNGIIIESVDQNNNIKKKCAVCNIQYCKSCLEFKHPYKCNNQQIFELIRDFNFRICDNCQNLVQRNEGCSHMTCKCGYQFCFDCQQKYISPHFCPVMRPSRRIIRLKMMEKDIQKNGKSGSIKVKIPDQLLQQQIEQKKLVKVPSKGCKCTIM